MAVVVTVHGTFASGPTAGDKWWQTGGPLEADILKYVRAQSGEIRIEPFVWDGANSEASRWKAANSLLDAALSYEKKQEPYSFIGHSHGGSVIAYMLSLATLRGNQLPHMSLWSTVGSPFMAVKPSGFFLNRLLPYEKLTLLATICGGLLAFYFFSLRSNWPRVPLGELVACILPAMIAFLIAWQNDRKRQFHTRDGHSLIVSSLFAARGLCLFHAEDEAINSLASASKARLRVFNSKFLTGISLSAVLLLTPVLFLFSFGLAAEVLIKILGIAATPAHSIAGYFDRWTSAADYVGSNYTDPFLFGVLGRALGYNAQLALLVAAFVVFCFAVFLAVEWGAGVVSRLLAERLNSLATFHVAQVAYGSDGVGTVVRGSGPNAFEENNFSRRLPIEIEEAVQRVADQAASKAITELRRKLGGLIASVGSNEHPGPGDHFLTWDELIHTTYFAISEMRVLLCCAIARADGFLASEQLILDERSTRMFQWLDGDARSPVAAANP